MSVYILERNLWLEEGIHYTYTLYIYTIHIHYTYTLYTIQYTYTKSIFLLSFYSIHTVSLVYTTYCLWTFGGGFVGWVDFRFVCRV